MIPPDRFIFLGHRPGVLVARVEGLSVLFPTYSRVPRACLTPERIASIVARGEAREKDDGLPFGPQRLHILDAWRASCGLNYFPDCAKRIWEILQEARCGLPHASPPKSRPEEMEQDAGYWNRRNRMETVVEYGAR